MSIKTSLCLFIVTCLLPFLHAQTDTTYYDALHEKIENRSIAAYYTVVSKRKNTETHSSFYVSGEHRSHYMYKKLPAVTMEEVVITLYGGDREPEKEQPLGLRDSVMTKHGTFMEWSETGHLTLQGTYFVGKLTGELNSFYSNQKPKRQDVYYLDTLKSGHCFDSLGVEIAHFLYQVKPEFKGGQNAMFRFLANTVKYPRDAREEGSAGTTYVSFVVSKDGKIKNVHTKLKINEKLDKRLLAESERVVKTMPNWKAGQVEGEKVDVRYILPIMYRIESMRR